LESLKAGDHSGNLIIDGRIILKWILEELNLRVWIRFISLKIKTDDGIL
jgi:hypothetical protein